MNTQNHILFNIAVAEKIKPGSLKYIKQIIAGGFMPDALMFVFYPIERWVFGHTSEEIWNERYFDSTWQMLIDIFNSVPLILLLFTYTYYKKARGWAYFFGSMLFHAALDLPVHNDDAHRHFWPITNYRYESPVSYWDPDHFGFYASIAEIILATVACIYIYRKAEKRWIKNTVIGFFVLNILMMAMFLFFFGVE